MGEGVLDAARMNEAGLPAELLSRLLFLEDAIAGRRVLCIGPVPAACVATLHGLGADEVRVLDAQDGQPYDADDASIDLLVDFHLPDALVRGEHLRLRETARVLSPGGFGWSALPTLQAPGWAAFSSMRALSPPAPHVAGGDEHPDGSTLAQRYRSWVDALQANFACVEVYFQSLMLGYYLGPFDFEEGREVLAPHTGLMQGRAEPASHYLFAFGQTVPVIRDISLVQVPLASLPVALDPAASPAPPQHDAVPRRDDADSRALQSLLEERSAALARLATGVHDLMEEREARDRQLRDLRAALDARSEALTAAEQRARAAVAQREALQRALRTRDDEVAALREELGAVRAALSRCEQQRDVEARDHEGGGGAALAALDAERCARLLGEALLEEARVAYRRAESERDWFKSALEELRRSLASRTA